MHPDLQVLSSNTSLIYISRGNGWLHLYKSTDPIFSADEEHNVPLPQTSANLTTTMVNTTVFLSRRETNLGAIACAEKVQFCNIFEHGQECSRWTGVIRNDNGETGIEDFIEKLSDEDKGLIELLIPSVPIDISIGQVAAGVGSKVLASQTQAEIILPMPGGPKLQVQAASGNEQWIEQVIECEIFHDFIMNVQLLIFRM
jgi:hypothetical protein